MIGHPPPPAADRPELPRVRLDVRAAGGRPVTYEVGGGEFLIGGAGGCDLRLPAANLPPVICQVTRKPDGVRARRLTPVLPVLLNGAPLPANAPAPVSPGDVIAVAGVEITVTFQAPAAVLTPTFVPLAPEPPAAVVPPAPTPLAAPVPDADLVRRVRDLDRQTEELEADRVLWYRRRREMEAEYERHRALVGDAERRAAELDAREADVAAGRDEVARREAEVQAAAVELDRRRAETAAEVAALAPQLQELRDGQDRLAAAAQELARQRELFAADRAIFDRAREEFDADRAATTERLTAWEAALDGRETDLSHREVEVAAGRAELDRGRQEFRDDLVRLERRTAAVEEREQTLAGREREVDARHQQMRREAGEWEETVRAATAEGERLRAEADRLDRQKADLDAQSATLAERAGQLESQQAVLAVLRAKLDRTRKDAEREVTQLAAARAREDEALAELRDRVREAEELRAELATVQADTARERRRLDERDSLLAAGLAEIKQQQDALAAEAARLRTLEGELDVRAAEFAEQAGTLKGRMTQALDLQARLEADRVAVREREAALAQAEDARQALQEQLRRRAEDLAARARSVDDLARQAAAERAAADEARSAAEAARQAAEDDLAARAREADARAAANAEKEQALTRQVARLKEVGASVAAERKSLAEARARWETDRAAAADAGRRAAEELTAFQARARAEIDTLREQAPELEAQARAALDRLSSARDALRGHLAELHDFARLSRDDLAAVRAQVRQEADRLRDQEEGLNRARAEHRLAVAAFRQQLVDWQAQVADIRRTVAGSESQLTSRERAVEAAARQADASAAHLAEEADRLRREREAVASRRAEVERHLADMRDWYRRKLRELAGGKAAETEAAPLKLHDPSDPASRDRQGAGGPPEPLPGGRGSPPEEVDPGDRQLGDLLRSHALVDADTLAALWAEAGRQRRTLRQVLLASGVVTLYQLALIEAGNLDALVVGRFRVIDRLRVTPREALYRVSDPAAPGVFLLRHLAEAEMHDAVRPDEFRQRFAAARDAAHPNLAAVVEVLEIAGRPAAVQEWPAGLYAPDWPAEVAHPGCWARLAAMAAAGVAAAHRHGLAHGRLTPDAFVLTPAGVLKVTGFGEPPWLSTSPAPAGDPSFAGDLRALGAVLCGWARLGAKGKKAKPFPEPLQAVVRRLEADPEPPMADTVAAGRPYESAADLAAELERVAGAVPAGDAWRKLLEHVAEAAPDAPALLKRSA
ncbi:MAG: hypothetical protein C0501_12150 [Isosphaera sp.]|nr:hypothetical protein [Isosphaera sp.]